MLLCKGVHFNDFKKKNKCYCHSLSRELTMLNTKQTNATTTKLLRPCWQGLQTDATTPNNVGATMLGVVASVLVVVCKRTQQLPTLLAVVASGLAVVCKWIQQCWDLQCIVGRIQPISLCKPCVTRVYDHNNVERPVQTGSNIEY